MGYIEIAFGSIDHAEIPDLEDWPLVYGLQAEHGGPIKIGKSSSSSLGSRVNGLQTGSPYKLVVRKTLGSGELFPALDVEAFLHTAFSDLRMHGEWFHPHPEIAVLLDAEPCADVGYCSKCEESVDTQGVEISVTDEQVIVRRWMQERAVGVPSKVFSVRAAGDSVETWRRCAELRGMTLNGWINEVLSLEAEKLSLSSTE